MRQSRFALTLLALYAGWTARPTLALPSCAAGAPYTFRAGLMDEFAAPPDPTSRGTGLAAAFPGAAWKDFDDATSDRFVGHTFTGLPTGIASAELVVRARPASGGPGNDSIDIGLVPPNHFAVAFQFVNLREAHGTWDVALNGPTTFTIPLDSSYPSLLAQMSSTHTLDVLVQDDTAVDYLELRVWTCPPPVISSSLPYNSLGQAKVATDPAGGIIVTNFGPSGADGVEAGLGRASGLALELSGGITPDSPDGSYVEHTLRGVAGGLPDRVLARQRATWVGGEVQVEVDATGIGAQSRTVELYDHGIFVTRVTGQTDPVAAGYKLYTGPDPHIDYHYAVGPTPFFEASEEGDFDFNFVCVLPALSQVRLGSNLFFADEIRIRPEHPQLPPQWMTSYSITGTGISSLGTAHGQLGDFGALFSPLGGALLNSSSGAMTVGGLSSSGQDGAVVNFFRTSSAGLSFSPIDPVGSSPVGTSLAADLDGSLNGVAGQRLATLTATRMADGGVNELSMSTDFSPLGASTHRVEVYDKGTLVAAFTGQTGPVVFGINIVVIWPVSLVAMPGGGFDLTWMSAGTFAVPGSAGTAGDEIRILPEAGPTSSIDYISGFVLRAAHLPEFTITNAQFTVCPKPTILRQPSSLTCAAGKPALFSVVADSPSSLSYRWRKDGADLADGGRVGGAATATLTLSPTILAQTGTYDVVISNACGSVVSEPASYQPGVALRSLLLTLVGDVHFLIGHGTFTAAEANSLSASLLKSLAFLHDADTVAAANRLDIFLARVKAFARNGTLTPTQAKALTATGADIRARFDC